MVSGLGFLFCWISGCVGFLTDGYSNGCIVQMDCSNQCSMGGYDVTTRPMLRFSISPLHYSGLLASTFFISSVLLLMILSDLFVSPSFSTTFPHFIGLSLNITSQT